MAEMSIADWGTLSGNMRSMTKTNWWLRLPGIILSRWLTLFAFYTLNFYF